MIFHLIYISEKTSSYQNDEVAQIIEKSQINNKAIEVTGLLLNKGKFFIQLLEGEKSAVEKLYEKIKRDPRHSSFSTLFTYTDNTRLFPAWSMGLVKVSESDPRMQELLLLLKSDATPAEGSKEKVISTLVKFNKSA